MSGENEAVLRLQRAQRDAAVARRVAEEARWAAAVARQAAEEARREAAVARQVVEEAAKAEADARQIATVARQAAQAAQSDQDGGQAMERRRALIGEAVKAEAHARQVAEVTWQARISAREAAQWAEEHEQSAKHRAEAARKAEVVRKAEAVREADVAREADRSLEELFRTAEATNLTNGKTESRTASKETPSRFSLGRPADLRTLARAGYLLNLLSAVVPLRIANEEIGDALEVIHAMVKNQRPAWSIYLKVARTIFWVCVHTAMEKFVGVVRIAMGQGDDRR